MNYSRGNGEAAANRIARRACSRYVRGAVADIAILAEVVREHPGLALKELAPLLKGRCSWTSPVSTITTQITNGLNRLGKAGIRVEHGERGRKPTRLWPDEDSLSICARDAADIVRPPGHPLGQGGQ